MTNPYESLDGAAPKEAITSPERCETCNGTGYKPPKCCDDNILNFMIFMIIAGIFVGMGAYAMKLGSFDILLHDKTEIKQGNNDE